MSDQFQNVTVPMLVAAYQSGQRLFEGIEIVGEGEHPCLTSLDLSGSEFTECWFHSATFSDVNFAGAKFRGCNLKCATFEACNLIGVKWQSSLVCSMAIISSATEGIEVKDLEAYGAAVGGVSNFLEYVCHSGTTRKATNVLNDI